MKKVLAILLFCGAIGLCCPKQNYALVKAEDTSEVVADDSEQETSSVVEEEQPQEEQEEKVEFFEDISQTAVDTIAVIKSVLNQPVVIGGVSMSLGAFLLWLLGKVIDKITTSKQGSESAEKIKELTGKLLDEKASREELQDSMKQLYGVVVLLANNTKNANLKENALALLEQCKPIVENNTNELKSNVVEDTTKAIVNTANSVIEILNKD